MEKNPSKTICILPELSGISGPPNFQNRLIGALAGIGIRTHHHPSQNDYSALLINGGSRRLIEVYQARRRGVRIVQRLNGMNWIHRKKLTGIKHFVRSEWNNFLLAYIRKHLADKIIYQSNFSRTWWQKVYGKTPAGESVIYNGVDLNQFTPDGPHNRPEDHVRLLMVEGGLGGGNEQGLSNGIELASNIALSLPEEIELMVAGRVPEFLKNTLPENPLVSINWAGSIPPDNIPFTDRSAHLLFSADLNAACPNSVIEALACGLPVVSYDTGALKEMVVGYAGKVVPYGSDYWNLKPPRVGPLAQAALEILANLQVYNEGAREHAKKEFDLNLIAKQYFQVLFS
jgi:glycosyltransferase involved in cell wall biosynthesis